MITAADLVRLPYTDDLTEAGIGRACATLSWSHTAAGAHLYENLRRSVAATAAQLGFRRHLASDGIDFSGRVVTPFTDPDRYDLQIGDRLVELKSYLLSRQSQIEALEQQPAICLASPMLVPLERHVAETTRGRDVYVFAFVAATTASSARGGPPQDGRRAYWMHAMPVSWRQPRSQRPCGALTVRSGGSSPAEITLVGEDVSGEPTQRSLRVGSGLLSEFEADFRTVTHLLMSAPPDGEIEVRAKRAALTHKVDGADWHDIWIAGRSILVLGWISREEFAFKARRVPEGVRVFQFDRTKVENLAVDAKRLHPLHDLIHRAGRYPYEDSAKSA